MGGWPTPTCVPFNSFLLLQKNDRARIEGLVGQLLLLTHGMWIERNGIVHERDKNGLKLKESNKLRKDIQAQYNQGYAGLAAPDYRYMDDDLNDILSKSACEQQTWLRGITIARNQEQTRQQEEEFELRKGMAAWLRRPSPL